MCIHVCVERPQPVISFFICKSSLFPFRIYFLRIYPYMKKYLCHNSMFFKIPLAHSNVWWYSYYLFLTVYEDEWCTECLKLSSFKATVSGHRIHNVKEDLIMEEFSFWFWFLLVSFHKTSTWRRRNTKWREIWKR